MTDLRALLDVTLASGTGPMRARLRMPATDEVHPLILEDHARVPALIGSTLPLLVSAFVEEIEGRPVTSERADAVARDASAMRALLQRIRVLLETMREEGRIFAECPRCGRWETELTVAALARAVAAPVPAIFDGPCFSRPALTSPAPGLVRPPIATAGRIRLALPSWRLEAGSPSRTCSFEGRVSDRAPDLPWGVDEDWPHTGPGWHALTRLSRLLSPGIPAGDLERLPAVDFFFLDAAYFLTAVAPVAPDTAGRTSCALCRAVFLPVTGPSQYPRLA